VAERDDQGYRCNMQETRRRMAELREIEKRQRRWELVAWFVVGAFLVAAACSIGSLWL